MLKVLESKYKMLKIVMLQSLLKVDQLSFIRDRGQTTKAVLDIRSKLPAGTPVKLM